MSLSFEKYFYSLYGVDHTMVGQISIKIWEQRELMEKEKEKKKGMKQHREKES